MKILATIPFGSRLYGTNDENSDHDWKHIVLPPLADMLIGVHLKNQFKSSSSDNVKNTSEDTDTELVPIQTFAIDVLNGQTYALELAFGILQRDRIDNLEVHDTRLIDFVEKLLRKFLTSNINKMVGYAYNQAQLYSEKGDRLDRLHKFNNLLTRLVANGYVMLDNKLECVMEHPEFESITTPNVLYVTVNKAPDGSEHRGVSVLGKFYPQTISIQESLNRLKVNIDKYGRRATESMINEGKDWKAISHALRITLEAEQVLTKSWITLPFKVGDVTLLKSIKYGQLPWDMVQSMLITNIDNLKVLQEKSSLPIKTEVLHSEFNDWLRNEMLNFYGVSNVKFTNGSN